MLSLVKRDVRRASQAGHEILIHPALCSRPALLAMMSGDAILANDHHAHNATVLSDAGHGLHGETPRSIHLASPHYS